MIKSAWGVSLLKLRVVLAVMFLILDCAKTIKSEHET
jgi:hypothetical protein